MTSQAPIWLVLLAAFIAANLPFVSQRLLLVGPRRDDKGLAWRFLEMIVLAAVALGIGLLLETRIGQAHDQGWQFYAAFGCLFLTLAFPGFVWRQLRRHP
jgi:Na+-driven multidrug efflux pump